MKHSPLLGRFVAMIVLLTIIVVPSIHSTSAQSPTDQQNSLSNAAAIALIDAGSYDPVIPFDDWMYWDSDKYFVGGRYTSNKAIESIGGVHYTSNDARSYINARVATSDLGSFEYTIPVSVPGTYTVVLDFAELYWGATNGGPGGAGRRIFSVNAEGGELEIPSIDINAEVGPMTKLSKTFDVAVTDGVLNIVFKGIVNRPLVSRVGVYLFNPSPPLNLEITKLYLVDVNTGLSMLTVTDGMVIDVSKLPSNHFALQAITTPSTVGSVTFGINKDGLPYGGFTVQNTKPYFYPGNQGSQISWMYSPDGVYAVKVTPYIQAWNRGVAGKSTIYTFTIINNTN